MRRTLSAILCLALACGPDAPSDESDTADTSEAADARDLPGLDYDAFTRAVVLPQCRTFGTPEPLRQYLPGTWLANG